MQERDHAGCHIATAKWQFPRFPRRAAPLDQLRAPTITPIDRNRQATRSRTPPRRVRPSRKSRRRKDTRPLWRRLGTGAPRGPTPRLPSCANGGPTPSRRPSRRSSPARRRRGADQGAGAREARHEAMRGCFRCEGAPRRSQRRRDAGVRETSTRVARRRAAALANENAGTERPQARGALRLVGAREARRARVRARPRLPLDNARRRDGVGRAAAVAEPLAASWCDNKRRLRRGAVAGQTAWACSCEVKQQIYAVPKYLLTSQGAGRAITGSSATGAAMLADRTYRVRTLPVAGNPLKRRRPRRICRSRGRGASRPSYGGRVRHAREDDVQGIAGRPETVVNASDPSTPPPPTTPAWGSQPS